MKSPRCPSCGGRAFSKTYIRGSGWTQRIDGDQRWQDDNEHAESYSDWTCLNCGFAVGDKTYLFEDLTNFFDTRPLNKVISVVVRND